ncbi:hypothetical protein I316_05000 [Kwoniella heveanensis BCC8398]|uniref:WSC domain-containing protein n=1 Tax=Kwoniella heveanensis BCC8398 TaxID=1296120 RepID=A0A1B9GQ89_9TREE|nr:hypothetical protein I316_05000 [Kwoniella heveanensis BCC8398]
MAPVVASTVALLALAGAASVDAKPLLKPGRHANPHVANVLASSKRSIHSLLARYYYGSEHGLTKPPPLPEKRDLALPAGWTYFGCVTESQDERLLNGFAFSSESLTPLLCVTQCTKLGYTFAGTEYGDECYCGDAFAGSGGGRADDSTCARPCGGDSSETCGDAWYLSLYQYNSSELAACSGTVPLATATATATASVVPTASESVTTEVVNGTTSVGTLIVVPTETGTEAVTSAITATNSDVTAVPTVGTTTTTSAALPVHTDATDSSEWYSLGCANDRSDRLLSGYSISGFSGMTLDSCLSLCEDKGFKYAGAEYGDECYCGDSIPDDITYNTDGACNVVCDGLDTEACGGAWSLDLYQLVSSASTNGTETDCSTSTLPSGALIATGGTTKTAQATTTTAHGVTTYGPGTTATSVTTTAAATTKVATTSATTAPASSTTAPSSSSAHSVWAHHMVGNTYPYGQADWSKDISVASAAGIDGFALNIGQESWQVDRSKDAYSAAGSSGFKLFLSLDMTSLQCSSSSDGDNLVSIVKQFASLPAQAQHEGKVLVSTFAGSDCSFGGSTWQEAFFDKLTNAGVNIFFVPSVFSDPSTFASNTWMDGELNWNSGWPMGGSDLDTSSDEKYIAALGDKEYMAAVSPFFFTHFPVSGWNKNWIYRSDNWLYATRWESLIAMRDKVKSVEILTWNDYGESSYIGPIAGALPSGSEAWTNGFDHVALNSLTKYYATAFKTGSYPTITKDEIVMWARPHPHDATASSDSTGRPAGWSYTEDYLYAVVLSTDGAEVTLTSGGSSQTFTVSAGLSKLKIPLSAGSISGSITRSGSTVASYDAGSSFTYTTTPSTYNFNYFVGSSS